MVKNLKISQIEGLTFSDKKYENKGFYRSC